MKKGFQRLAAYRECVWVALVGDGGVDSVEVEEVVAAEEAADGDQQVVKDSKRLNSQRACIFCSLLKRWPEATQPLGEYHQKR